MADGDRYRIKWAVVQRCNGYRCWPERMCIAQRRVRFLWLIPMWWPVNDWRMTEGEAEADIHHDINLRSPLPTPRAMD